MEENKKTIETNETTTASQKISSSPNDNKPKLVIGAVISLALIIILALIFAFGMKGRDDTNGDQQNQDSIEESTDDENQNEINEEEDDNNGVDEEDDDSNDSPREITGEFDSTPKINAIYYDTYNGEDALFMTDEEKRIFYDGGEERTLETIGNIYQNTTSQSQFDYNILNSPRRLVQLDENTKFESLSFSFDDQKEFLYLTVVEYEKGTNIFEDGMSVLYQIELESEDIVEIWSKSIGNIDDDRYGNNSGAAYMLDLVGNEYAIISIADCYACGPGPTDVPGKLVINMNTQEEVYLGDVEYLRAEDGKVYYQEMQNVEEECDAPGQFCEDGKYLVARASGPELTISFP